MEKQEKYIFKDWKERCSQLGHLLTNLETITPKQLLKISELCLERDTLINANGNTVKWSANKETELNELIAKRDKPDSLPPGAITHLESVFREVFWGRRRLLHNKFLDKGNLMEQDAFALLTTVDTNTFYTKNTKSLEHKYLTGTADIVTTDMIIDTKCNYDLESFDNAELTKLYEWQIKGYCIGYGKKKGRVAYCLVNNPSHQLIATKNNTFYQMGQPEPHEERWEEVVKQIERNMIFDSAQWKKEVDKDGNLVNRNYDFENKLKDIDNIPAKMRVKIFEVTLEDGDEEIINSRVKLAREWLINKEIETLNKLKN